MASSQRSTRTGVQKRPATKEAKHPSKKIKAEPTVDKHHKDTSTSTGTKRQKSNSSTVILPTRERKGVKDKSSKEAMDSFRSGSGDSASDAPMSGAGTGHPNFGSTFSFFMKRSGNAAATEGLPFGFGSSSSSSQFTPLLRDLRSEDGHRQLMALTELSEQLSFSSEEALISFPMETFIPQLVTILGNPGNGDEITAQVMLLSCRCLYNVVDILPPTARLIVRAGGLPVLCAQLLNVEYIDVAELTVSIVELIAQDQPLQVLKAGGLQATLAFLDFFQMSVQRQAANAAALMLLPVPPTDVLEEHIKPVLPTLTQLLQHSDPQVLQSICECWRRALDGAIAAYQRPVASAGAPSTHGGPSPSSMVARLAADARRLTREATKQDIDEEDEDDDEDEEDYEEEDEPMPPPATPALPSRPLAVALQEMCPSSVVSNLLLLLGSPQNSVVVTEALYILSVLANFSDSCTKEVLEQDIISLLRQMLLGMDFVSVGGTTGTQANSSLLRILALITSMLPAVQIQKTGCICEERRLALFREHPSFLEALTKAFSPLLLDIFEGSMDPSVQSLCVSLLLAFFLTSREQPQLSQCLEPTKLASFLANLLLAKPSRSIVLACLLIVKEILDHHADAYSLSFARHGVIFALDSLKEKRLRKAPPLPVSDAPEGEEGCSLSALIDEVLQTLFATHFATTSHIGETQTLQSLKQIAGLLKSSPDFVTDAHREALSSFRSLLLSEEGITTFELSGSSAADALCSFLFPAGESHADCSERLRLFLECFVTPPGSALLKLVRLCVSTLQRVEHQPLTLFPTEASTAAFLPRHLATNASASPSRELRPSTFSEFAFGFPSSRLSSGSGGSNASPLLSVLRLLAKPVRVRMGPLSDSSAASANTARSILTAPTHPPVNSLGSSSVASSEGSKATPKSFAAQLAAAASEASTVSPAARLRNFLASKAAAVSRKRGVPSLGASVFGLAGSTAASLTRTGTEPRGEGSQPHLAHAQSDPIGLRSRDREEQSEVLEAVLLVEPFAQVTALEDYVWDRHGSSAAGGDGSPVVASSAMLEGAETVDGAPPRVRLTMKQPPASALAKAAAAEARRAAAAEAEMAEARSPRAVPVDDGSSMPAPTQADSPTSGTPSAVAVAEKRKQTVRIFYNGQALSSKTSVVQVLVRNASKAQGSSPGQEPVVQHQRASALRTVGERFLPSLDEADADVGDGDASPGFGDGPRSAKSTTSRHYFCGAIWGRVHSMQYELIPEPLSPRASEQQAMQDVSTEISTALVNTEFDCLVHSHLRIATNVANINTPSGPSDTTSSEEPPTVDEYQDLSTILKLLSAFYNLSLYKRSAGGDGAVDEDSFHCISLTSTLLRQLSDPLAVCTGSVPAWCLRLAGACRFLFPFNVRRILHHSCNLGLGRALHHVQQRALAQNAHSPEAQRRLEAEVSVASVPRQKVRISRQRLLESAVKVMNMYGAGNAILEVEYVGEVGTGSGPTLEFYAQVADILRTSDPPLFRKGTPMGMLFPEPYDPEWLRKGEAQAAQQILERFRLLGHMVAKCILDSRLLDVQLHPAFWRSVLGTAPFSEESLREIDPELSSSLTTLRSLDDAGLSSLAIDFTLPGHDQILLKPDGNTISLSSQNLEEYLNRVTEVSLVEAIAPQLAAFRTAFQEFLPLETCRIWSEKELACIIVGSSVRDDSYWTMEHLSSHIKAQHGYTGSSRVFRELLELLGAFSPEQRREFLAFTTGAPSLPIGGFAGLKPPLTVVKKEAPLAPLTPDDFMPSVMTCANYLKLPEYSSAEVLKLKLEMAMREGQSAFLLS